MGHMKFYVQSWKQVEVEEQLEVFDSEGNSDTIKIPSTEVQDFESTEFDSLEDAKAHYNGLPFDKIAAIQYECTGAESFKGQKTFKHSQVTTAAYEAKEEAYINACIADCEAREAGE
tara:strand:+ start:209 stop:559 length:351 start_codon:yes stop_codon:yes gene_type:complete